MNMLIFGLGSRMHYRQANLPENAMVITITKRRLLQGRDHFKGSTPNQTIILVAAGEVPTAAAAGHQAQIMNFYRQIAYET